jgi:hypothetical protein
VVVSPTRILRAWEAAAAQVAHQHPTWEPQIIAVPDDTTDGKWMLTVFVEVENGSTFEGVCDHLMTHLVSEPAPAWIAHCSPVYSMVVDDPSDLPEGGLAEAARAGDERVENRVHVTVVTRDHTYGQSFVPPLNEPDGPVLIDADGGGRISGTLRAMIDALWSAR